MTKEEAELFNDEDEEDDDVKTPKIKWLPLESNPDVLNKIIHENGVNPEWKFVDIIGLDEESIAAVPRPAAAILFLYPVSKIQEEFCKQEDTHLKAHEQNISYNLVYFKQTISNACGMMALLHTLANNDHLVGPGLFSKIIEDTRCMSPQERGEYLETCQELAQVHDKSAHCGQTATPALSDPVSNHFIAFVQVDDHLYELDGRRIFPINHGKSYDLVQDSVKIMQQSIEREPNQEYVAIAFSKIEDST